MCVCGGGGGGGGAGKIWAVFVDTKKASYISSQVHS